MPTLRDSSSVSSFRFATTASASACRSRDRSFADVLPQSPPSAARADSTAWSISASPASWAVANGSPEAGSTRSREDDPPTVSPLMKSPYSRPVATAIGPDDTGLELGTYAYRRGRRTSSPPQFGQTPSSSAEQDGQNVHS